MLGRAGRKDRPAWTAGSRPPRGARALNDHATTGIFALAAAVSSRTGAVPTSGTVGCMPWSMRKRQYLHRGSTHGE